MLICIDEMSSNEYMKVFASSFQIFVRQELPAFLLGTGLYENIDKLQNEKNLTFLYRAPKIQLKPLNIYATASKYQSIFKLSESDAFKWLNSQKDIHSLFRFLDI